MRIIGVIPARYKSTRFPGKPLALINGMPMIWWTYQQACKVKQLDRVIVATDDDRIAAVCRENSMEYVMTDQKHLTGTDRLAEVAEKVKADIYINIQGDEPLIEPEVVSELVEFMICNQNYSCATVRSKISNPVDVINTTVSKIVVDFQSDIMYISKNPIPYPKSSLNYSYYKALGLYAFRPEALAVYRENGKGMYETIEDIEMLRLVEKGIKVRSIEAISDSPSVDTPKDAIRIEEILKGKSD